MVGVWEDWWVILYPTLVVPFTVESPLKSGCQKSLLDLNGTVDRIGIEKAWGQ